MINWFLVGLNAVYEDGFKDGYDIGYKNGKKDCLNNNNSNYCMDK